MWWPKASKIYTLIVLELRTQWQWVKIRVTIHPEALMEHLCLVS